MNQSSVDSLIKQWVRPEIQALSAYAVPESGGMVKLDAMENPYSMPDELRQAWLQELTTSELNRYPDPNPKSVKQALREVMAIPEQSSIMLGNGSDELIQILELAVAGSGRCILAPTPTFVMYEHIAHATATRFIGVPLRPDFGLDITAMLAAIDQHQPALVFLAYPNNPTGNLFDRQQLEQIIGASPGLVVLDEAYHAFAGKSFIDQAGDVNNLLVMRTLSKLGLAGLRLGLLTGPAAWIAELDKVRLPYNINQLTQRSVRFSMAHAAVFTAQAEQICAQRETLMGVLSSIAEIKVYPSAANFILFRCLSHSANKVFKSLLGHNILIKNMHRDQSPLSQCLRVTVGSAGENEKFVTALRSVLFN